MGMMCVVCLCLCALQRAGSHTGEEPAGGRATKIRERARAARTEEAERGAGADSDRGRSCCASEDAAQTGANAAHFLHVLPRPRLRGQHRRHGRRDRNGAQPCPAQHPQEVLTPPAPVHRRRDWNVSVCHD